MTRFTVTCQCHSEHISLRSPANYSADIIKNIYCPKCFKRSADASLKIDIAGKGKYAIEWNLDVLKKIDPEFEKNKFWKENFFGKRKLIFDFIHPHQRNLYTVLDKKD